MHQHARKLSQLVGMQMILCAVILNDGRMWGINIIDLIWPLPFGKHGVICNFPDYEMLMTRAFIVCPYILILRNLTLLNCIFVYDLQFFFQIRKLFSSAGM